jgi:hypothetical protein
MVTDICRLQFDDVFALGQSNGCAQHRAVSNAAPQPAAIAITEDDDTRDLYAPPHFCELRGAGAIGEICSAAAMGVSAVRLLSLLLL